MKYRALLMLLFLFSSICEAKNSPFDFNSINSDKVKEIESCNWNNPGQNPFTGDRIKALDNFPQLDIKTRELLQERLKNKIPDEVVEISKTSIKGITSGNNYNPNIEYMHFGKNNLCKKVNYNRWKNEHTEKAEIYCVDEKCIIIPFICGNISFIKKKETDINDILNTQSINNSMENNINSIIPIPIPNEIVDDPSLIIDGINNKPQLGLFDNTSLANDIINTPLINPNPPISSYPYLPVPYISYPPVYIPYYNPKPYDPPIPYIPPTGISYPNDPITSNVPEPSSYILYITGLVIMLMLIDKRKKKQPKKSIHL